MRLTDLNAQFLKRLRADLLTRVDALADADGVQFLCPICFDKNKGPIGTHSVLCWFVGRVPDDMTPGPGRWNPSGAGIDDLTFVGPGQTSVKLESGCLWHGHVENGEATLG